MADTQNSLVREWEEYAATMQAPMTRAEGIAVRLVYRLEASEKAFANLAADYDALQAKAKAMAEALEGSVQFVLAWSPEYADRADDHAVAQRKSLKEQLEKTRAALLAYRESDNG